jgi:hypothetical protein
MKILGIINGAGVISVIGLMSIYSIMMIIDIHLATSFTYYLHYQVHFHSMPTNGGVSKAK